MDLMEMNKRVLCGITQLLTTSLPYLLLFKNTCYIRRNCMSLSLTFEKAFDLISYAKLWPI